MFLDGFFFFGIRQPVSNAAVSPVRVPNILKKKNRVLVYCVSIALGKIARPDAIGKTAANLGVLGAGENLGVAGLASVIPALGSGVADRGTEARQVGKLTKPATDEDRLKVAIVTGSHDLGH